MRDELLKLAEDGIAGGGGYYAGYQQQPMPPDGYEPVVRQPQPEGPVKRTPQYYDKNTPMPPHPLATIGKRVGMFSLGLGAGYLGLHGANALARKYTGKPLIDSQTAQMVTPAVAGLGAMAYDIWKNELSDKTQRDAEIRRGLRDSQES